MNYTRVSILHLLETGLSSGQLLHSDSNPSQNVPICLRRIQRQEGLGMRLRQIRTFFEKSCLLYQYFAVSQSLQIGAITRLAAKAVLPKSTSKRCLDSMCKLSVIPSLPFSRRV